LESAAAKASKYARKDTIAGILIKLAFLCVCNLMILSEKFKK
jgi:hypothetical protein